MVFKVALVAGESSGDLLGANLLDDLRKLHPDLIAVGIGGELMRQSGCQTLYSSKELSVMGLLEPLSRLPRLFKIRRSIYRYFIDFKPDVFIGIDAPDFNLSLAGKLKKAGITTVHYVSPTVWAWRQYRIAKIAKSIDLMLTLFPFEAQFYHKYHIPVKFVGHPLADNIPFVSNKMHSRKNLHVSNDVPIVALLPGSRLQEIQHLGKIFLAAGKLCWQQQPRMEFVTSSVDAELNEMWKELAKKYAPGLPLKFFVNRTQEVISASDVALVTSGTVTLEVMLCKRPMVIAYCMAALNFYLAKMLVNTKFIGLPNLLANKELVPEFIQHAATPENLSQSVLSYITHPHMSSDVCSEFAEIHHQLAQNASLNAANAISELVFSNQQNY